METVTSELVQGSESELSPTERQHLGLLATAGEASDTAEEVSTLGSEMDGDGELGLTEEESAHKKVTGAEDNTLDSKGRSALENQKDDYFFEKYADLIDDEGGDE